jgi:hypothetical protein
MSVTATAVIFGLFVLLALKANWVRPMGMVVCVLFGLLLGATAIGPGVNTALDQVGTSMWHALQGL